MVVCAKTVELIFTIYTSNNVFLHKQVLFGDCDEAVPNLRSIIPQNLHFWGVNRHFQAKLVKYQHLHIIKTISSIRTKFCTIVPNFVGIDGVVSIICKC